MTAKMGDIVSATRENMPSGEKGLQDLVRKIPPPKDREQLPGYRTHVELTNATRPKRPVEYERRSAAITMRLTPTERLTFIRWCEDQNLSMSDGLVKLMELNTNNGS